MTIKQKGAWTIESLDEDLRRELVRCEDQSTVHISASCICDRFAFRGVPARSVDVLVDQRILSHRDDDLSLILSRSWKTGKYDHTIRDRWMVRRMKPDNVSQLGLPAAECLISQTIERLSIRVLSGGAVTSAADYDRLPPVSPDYDQIRCVKRNWTRYFRHLSWDSEVLPRLSDYVPFGIEERTTLSELNMHASRWLADVSYELGWNRVVAAAAARKGMPVWTRDEPTPDTAIEDELYKIQDRLS